MKPPARGASGPGIKRFPQTKEEQTAWQRTEPCQLIYFSTGNAGEAVTYYAEVLQTDPPEVMYYDRGLYPSGGHGGRRRPVMHASIAFENQSLMISDEPKSNPQPVEHAMIVLSWGHDRRGPG